MMASLLTRRRMRGLDGRTRTDAGFSPPDLQSGAFVHLATSRKLAPRAGLEPAASGSTSRRSSTELAKHLRKGSGDGFRSRPIVAADFRCGERELSRGFGFSRSTPAVPLREPSRRMRCLAARGGQARRAHPGPRTPRCLRRRSAKTHPEWKRESENKKARILCGIRASGVQSAAGASSDAAASRIGAILGLAMVRHLPRGQAARTQRKGACERTQAGEGLGVAKGVPAVHDGCPGSVPSEACESSKGLGGALRAKDHRSSKRQDAV